LGFLATRRFRAVKELIGFNIIAFAIDLLITLVMGWDLDTKDKLLLITGEPIILGIISVGIYLLVGEV
jgi:hypothetical protein